MTPRPPANMFILDVLVAEKGRQGGMALTSLTNILIVKLLQELKPVRKCQYFPPD